MKALLEVLGRGGWISSLSQESEAGVEEGGRFLSALRAEGGAAAAGF